MEADNRKNGGDVYSVDMAVRKAQPRIELRGVIYDVADLHPGEEQEAMIELAEAEERIVGLAEGVESKTGDERQEVFAALRVATEAATKQHVMKLLVDLPEEVAGDLTLMEYKAIMAVIGVLQATTPLPEKKDSAPGK